MGEAVAEATSKGKRKGGRPSDALGGDIRRRDVFPLLVLHLISREEAYGNRLIEEIERITEGVISVNPNTIYPLLREMEADGLIEGRWEHPDRRSRRYYSITAGGPARAQAPARRGRALHRVGDQLDVPAPERALGRPWVRRGRRR